MPDSRLPRKLFYGELAEGKRTQGDQKKRFKDTLKVSLKSFGINTDTWETQAQDRLAWRSHISGGAASFEQHRIVEAQRKRELRKSTATTFAPADFLCLICGKAFHDRIGLINHSRTHR